MKPVRVGIVGTGWGELQIESFRRVKGVQVVALCDNDPERLDKTSKKHEIQHTFDDYRELVKSPQVDWVSIAAPPALHEEMVRAAIEAGKPVLSEKPVALGREAGAQLLRAAEENSIVHAVDYEMRFLPSHAYAKELIEEDYLGPLLRVDVTLVMERPWGEHGNWAARQELGGGLLAELGSHFLDTLLWWFGPVSSVFADVHTNFPKTHGNVAREPGNGKHVDELATGDDAFWCVLQFEGGGQVLLNFLTGARHDAGWTIGAYGQTGALVVRSGQLMGMRQGDREMGLLPIPKRLELGDSPSDPLMWAMSRLIERVLAKISGQGSAMPFPTFREAMAVTELIQAIRVASAERRWVSIA